MIMLDQKFSIWALGRQRQMRAQLAARVARVGLVDEPWSLRSKDANARKRGRRALRAAGGVVGA